MECRQEAVPGRSHCRDHLGGAKRRSFNPVRACICGTVGCTRHGRKPAGTSGWARYVEKFPDRASFYQSGAWKSARNQHLAAHPFCVVCGAKATHVDHRIPRVEGGADLDPSNLESLCKEHHRLKTLAESHRGRKRAAEERRRRRGRS